jgi:hypothetical protein
MKFADAPDHDKESPTAFQAYAQQTAAKFRRVSGHGAQVLRIGG